MKIDILPKNIKSRIGDYFRFSESTSSTKPDHPDDPLLSCLEYLAQKFGKPFSRASALSGLPLKSDRLTVDLFPRAAARLGLNSKLVKRKIHQVPSLVTPFIVLFESGDAGVVIEKKSRGRRLSIVFPAISKTPKSAKVRELEKDASAYVIYVTVDDVLEDPSNLHNRSNDVVRHWLWSVVWNFWPSWLQIILTALVINLLGLALPIFIMNAYDRVIPNLAIPTLWALTAGVAIALFFDFLLKQLRAVVLDQTGRRVDMKVASSLFERALGISMAKRPDSAGVVANQIREFEVVRDFFTSSSIIAVTDLLFIGVFIAVLWLIVGPIAYVALIAVPVVLIVTLFIQIPLSRSVERTQSQAARRHSILIESLIGVETIKSLSAEGVLQRQWEEAVAGTARANSSTKFWSSLALYFTAFVQQAVSVIIVIWGVFLISDGVITIGALIAANILSGRVLAPLGNIALTLARAQHAFTALRGINGFMKLEDEHSSALRSGKKVDHGSIEFRNVSFSYPRARSDALTNANFVIKAGEKVGLLGRVGSGKTTIGKLMSGLYTVDKGFILIDDFDSHQYELAELRAGVGYLSQEPELFAGTLRDNIILGKTNATESEIDEAVRLAGVDTFIDTHPDGLGMIIGERGRGLSGGQRQAVSLARILIRQPKILFLDEPSSAMDTVTESAVIENLRALSESDYTLIISTHRMAFLNLVERLIVVDHGKIVADGPKESVLEALRRGQQNQESPENKEVTS